MCFVECGLIIGKEQPHFPKCNHSCTWDHRSSTQGTELGSAKTLIHTEPKGQQPVPLPASAKLSSHDRANRMCACDVEANELLGGMKHDNPIHWQVSHGAQTTLDLLAIPKLFCVYLPDDELRETLLETVIRSFSCLAQWGFQLHSLEMRGPWKRTGMPCVL